MTQSPTLDPTTRDFIQAMPKAEIHIHLEGAIQPETLLELARRHRREDSLPTTDLDGLRRWFTFTDFPHFIQIYWTISDLLRTPEDFALIVHACGADMAAQNIRYRELTFTPFTHTDLQQKGLTMGALFEGLEAGRAQAKRDFGVEMRWVFDIPRNTSFKPWHSSLPIRAAARLADGALRKVGLRRGEQYHPYPAERTLAYALAGQDKGVVGFGLGGYEVGAPPEPFAHVFRTAKAAGLLSVPHAGETVGPASIWGAVNTLAADRIGHGVRAIEDEALLALLRERQIPLELNPTSNICLHVYSNMAEHPFPKLDQLGLLVTVNSDDPPLFNTSLTQEYQVLATHFGYAPAALARVARNAFVAAGAPAALKAQLLQEFDEWVQKQANKD
ncbi:MAG: adenosine deaminase family protein [Caldilineaceae bacterium]|nr:adenosine deaminase family protein [Caldilineaceae bacterium]